MRNIRVLWFVAALLLPAAARPIGNDSRSGSDEDPGKNSGNIHKSGRLTPTKTHPYAGFWKINCSDAMGLAIAEAGSTLYTVSFCGPGSCFKPGTYRPNTYLIDDPDFKIESPTRMLIRDFKPEFKAYQRCWPPP